MSGLASLNRYWHWGSEQNPWPGELEYLNGGTNGVPARAGFDKLVRMPPALHLGSETVKRDTSSYTPRVDNTTHERQI